MRSESGRSEEETEQACDFWADRGIVEWTALGHVALTHIGSEEGRAPGQQRMVVRPLLSFRRHPAPQAEAPP